jgi:hypothetical protein
MSAINKMAIRRGKDVTHRLDRERYRWLQGTGTWAPIMCTVAAIAPLADCFCLKDSPPAPNVPSVREFFWQMAILLPLPTITTALVIGIQAARNRIGQRRIRLLLFRFKME